MKTTFAAPSNTYSIVLNMEDLMKLGTGCVMYAPTHTPNRYIDRSSAEPYSPVDVDGHMLFYHGPEYKENDEGKFVQFVCIRLEREEK